MNESPEAPSRRRFIGLGAASAAALAFSGRLTRARDASLPAMTHRERIERVIRLDETDRLPWSFWWHFPNRDRSPRRLAELSLQLQRWLDTDFIKLSPYGLYSVVDWGVTLDVRGGDLTPVQADYPIKRPADWRKLRPIPPDEGEYLIVLEAQRLTLAERSNDVPVVQTVFSPLTSCLKMAGRDTLLRHIAEDPAAVHAGLAVVTETTRRFAVASVGRGADGLFFATQMATRDSLNAAQYAEFAKPYDLEVLEAVRDRSWFNIYHLHGAEVMFEQVLDAPVQAFSYHDREFGPSLGSLRGRTSKCLVGGIDRGKLLVSGTPAEVDVQVRDAWEQVDRRGLILGPGCVANVKASEANLLQLRRSVERTAAL
jgi:uroporphyrinogen decarboxylase